MVAVLFWHKRELKYREKKKRKWELFVVDEVTKKEI